MDGNTITYADEMTNGSSGFNIETAMSIIVAYCFICGIVAALIARHNGRSVPLGFMAGFFMGHIGIAAHMIMGKSKD